MARDEMLDLLPESTFFATLILGGEKVACQIIEEMNAVLIVAVPGIERYEGNARLTLRMNRTTMAVRLVLQEQRLNGYLFQLCPVNDVRSSCSTNSLSRFLNSATRFVAMAVIAVTVVYVPTMARHSAFLGAQTVSQNVIGLNASSRESGNVAPNLSVNQLFAANELRPQRHPESREGNPVSISMISSASSASGDRQANDSLSRELEENSLSVAGSQRGISLKSLLKAGQVGRVQVLAPELAPWLYTADQKGHALAIRISDATFGDLRQFASGLRGLTLAEATRSTIRLRETLLMVEHSVPDARLVEGTSDVFVVASEDANVYFRLVNGKTEVVRILPIDLNEVDR